MPKKLPIHLAERLWYALLVTCLSLLMGLCGISQGQERPTEGARPAAVLEEAKRLDEQISKLHGAGKYDAAIPLAQRALALREQVLGLTHPSVATSLNNLAALYRQQGADAQAEPLYQRVLALREQVLGPMHPDVAVSLSNLGLLYQARGATTQAVPLLQRALAIAEQALGPEHPQVAIFLDNLAGLYRDRQAYTQAELLYQRALAIFKKVLGPAAPDVATTLNNLAALYQVQGAYEQAAPLLQRALALREQGLGPRHPDVATSLNNLAALYWDRGNYEQATSLMQRALALRQQVLGPMHPDVASTLNNLAVLYQAHGAYEQAAPLLQEVITRLEQQRGPTHPDVATARNNLGVLYQAQGAYAQALPLYQQALTLREQVLGPEHPQVATSLMNLAALYRDQGAYEQAAPLLQRALTLFERVLGPQHPQVATTLTNLALLYEAQGHVSKAIAMRSRRDEIREHLLARLLSIGAEAEKRAALATLDGETWATVSLHTQSAPHDAEALRLALTTVLRRKGRVLDVMTTTLDTLRRHLGPAEQHLLDQWATTQAQLSALALRGLRGQDPALYRKQLVQLDTQVRTVEAQLSTRNAEFRTQTTPVSLDTIQQALPLDAALVEIVWYRPSQPRLSSLAERWAVPRYVAYVLRHQGAPQWVDLGEAAGIDREVLRLRRELSCASDRQGITSDVETALQRCRTRLPQVQSYARTLDDKLMRPLRPLLGQARLILLVPDGALHLLPFGALVDEHRQYLLERFTFSYLTTGRDLLRLQIGHTSQQPPLVLANPTFDPDGLTPSLQTVAERRSSALRSVDFTGLRFEPLPGTAGEAIALQRLFSGGQVLTGAAATETALKQSHGPRFLHVATHGFFLPDSPRMEQSEGTAVGTAMTGISPRLWTEQPLLRAGLALAGANGRQSGAEDGVLTALEASGLDLRGTQLVVLSACETGVGDVQNGEGVYGLRRALVMAGAESQVMSLWKVHDEATHDLMVTYYTRLLAGEGRAEALRQAQLALLANPEQRHPFFWASFIPLGAWRPLEARGPVPLNP